MVKKAQIARGKKWTKARETAVFGNMNNDVKWIDTNPCIQADIKAYEATLLKPTIKPVGKK